jgi:hypothetical protein
MNSILFWDVTKYSLVEIYKCFGGMYCLHLQDQRASQVSWKLAAWLLGFFLETLENVYQTTQHHI